MVNTEISVAHVDKVVAGGKAVISADNSVVVSLIKDLVISGQTATFYVSSLQYLAVKCWYWTPEVMAKTSVKVVPDDEIARIGKELDMTLKPGRCFSNYRQCPNGHSYGAYEFIKEGLNEHGRQLVKDLIGGDTIGASVVRVNPLLWEHCPVCDAAIMGPHYYSLSGLNGKGYQCCRGGGLAHLLTK